MTRSNCLCSNRSSTSLCNHRSPTSSKPSSRSNRPSEWRCSCSDCARLGVAWQFAHLIVDILELCYAIKMDITSRARLWSACLYDFYCRTAGKSSKPQCQTQYILPNTAYSTNRSIFISPIHLSIYSFEAHANDAIFFFFEYNHKFEFHPQLYQSMHFTRSRSNGVHFQALKLHWGKGRETYPLLPLF